MPRKEKLKFEFEEKKFTLLLKREVCGYFWLETATFSNKLNFFFLAFKFWFFFARQLRMTILDCCISLKRIKKILYAVQFFKPQTSIFSTRLNFFFSGSNFDFSSRGNSKWPYYTTVLVWTVYKICWLCWELWICATFC